MRRLRRIVTESFLKGLSEELGVSPERLKEAEAHYFLFSYKRFIRPLKAKLVGKHLAKLMKELVKDNPEPFVPEPVKSYAENQAKFLGKSFREVLFSKPIVKYWLRVRGRGVKEDVGK